MISALADARCRTAAGVSERQLYWAVYALRQHVAAAKAKARHSAIKLSATYRIWRQILEDQMHQCAQCVIRWQVHSKGHSLHAGHVWPAMARSDHIWATMAAALLSVLGTPVQQATSVWFMKMKTHQQHGLRGLAKPWVTPGIGIFLEIMVRRKAQAMLYIDRM